MRRHAVLFAVAAGLPLAAWVAFAQAPAPRAAAGARPPTARPAATGPSVATIGDLRIPRAEFDQRFELAMRQYKDRTGTDIPEEYRPPLRRQLLETLIRQRLVILEARRRGLTATVEEAEAALRRDPAFQENGAFSEAKFLAIRTSQPQAYQAAIAELRTTLPARRLLEAIERENAPKEKELQERAARKLSRASLSYLALRRSDFEGDFPEPTEAEILAYHRAHPGDYRKSEEVRATVVVVNQPALADSLSGNEIEMRAWEQRMQQRADSAIGAIRRGTKVDAVAALNGWSKQSVVLRRDGFPSYWKGDASTNDAVFALKTGDVLPKGVPATDGRLIVRVDGREAAGFASLASASRDIRHRLRSESRARWEDLTLRSIYDAVRDSLRGPAWRVRYAMLDTASLRLGEPGASELDRYYRGHLADYSSFDAASGAVVAKPLREVREDVRRRMLVERRDTAMRAATERLVDAWSHNRRDAATERGMTAVREVGPLIAGSVVDTGLAGAALTDTMATQWGQLGVGVAPYARGIAVYHVFAKVADYTPTFDQARGALSQRVAPRRDAAEEAEARRLYDADPSQFRTGDVMYFSRLVVEPADPLKVELTRPEVERFYKEHLDRYSAPELSRVRHILVEPRDASREADEEARREAESLLKRIQAGENFADLARQFSDDPATKEQGGDVGVFRRGMMLEEFERAAFSMRPGDVRGPIRTPAGYHVIECLEYVPQDVAPLKYSYTNVAGDLAQERANDMARQRADSLYRALKTPAQARAVAKKSGFMLISNEYPVGGQVNARDLVAYFHRLEQVKPGHFYPGVQEYKGLGWVVSWVDSVAPERVPPWSAAREKALDLVRRQGSLRKLEAKRAELDSMARAGWSLDSLAALWGGIEHLPRVAPGTAIPRLGGKDEIDSLAFGVRGRPAALAPGQTTGWVKLVNGYVRFRMDERFAPDPVELAGALQSDRRILTEKNLQATFDKLKARFPVRIQDAELRATALPQVPDS